jgi:hypothetical protein
MDSLLNLEDKSFKILTPTLIHGGKEISLDNYNFVGIPSACSKNGYLVFV